MDDAFLRCCLAGVNSRRIRTAHLSKSAVSRVVRDVARTREDLQGLPLRVPGGPEGPATGSRMLLARRV